MSEPARRPPRQSRPPRQPPEVIAAIDIGAHAIRLAIAEVAVPRTIRRLESLSVPVAVGFDTFHRGVITASTAETVGQTLRDFRTMVDGYKVSTCRTLATSAVRDAQNRDVFIDRVEHISGIRPEVIEPIEETRLLYQMVEQVVGSRFGFRRGVCMLLSLGAGGTQILVQQRGRVVLSETRALGALRLLRSAPGPQPLSPAALAGYLTAVARSLVRVRELAPIHHLLVFNEEIPTLLERALRTRKDAVGLTVDRAELEAGVDALIERSPDALARDYRLTYPEAEIVRMFLVELRAFLGITACLRVAFPAVSPLEAILWDALLARRPQPSDASLERHVESAAFALGEKLRFDAAHARQVQKLALALYDGLADFCGLEGRARLYLSIAALLHDVGTFVSARAHHKHSAYLIASSEILGLSQEDLRLVALVARAHRRAFPPADDGLVASLSTKQRVQAVKLASLLRIADALDRDRQQRIQGLEVEVRDGQVELRLASTHGSRDEFRLVELAVQAKADLFEEAFGVRPQLTESLGV